MALDTYANLKVAISNWSDRNDVSLDVDDFIDLTEAMLKRPPSPANSQLLGGVRADKQRATGTLTSGTRTLARPSNFLTPDTLTLTSSPITALIFVPPEQMAQFRRESTGRPRYWSVQDVIEFDISPDSDYAYELSYWPEFEALSDGQPANWALTNFPDLYLFGCLMQLSTFVGDPQEEQKFAIRYKDAAHGANGSYRMSTQSRGSIMQQSDRRRP